MPRAARIDLSGLLRHVIARGIERSGRLGNVVKLCRNFPLTMCTNIDTLAAPMMLINHPLHVKFFQLDSGREPVRDWLKKLPAEERKIIGEDIKTVQWGWPIGMPLVRPLGDGLFEVRSTLQNRIARVLFTMHGSHIVLLHGFFKQTQQTPDDVLRLAKKRKAMLDEKT